MWHKQVKPVPFKIPEIDEETKTVIEQLRKELNEMFKEIENNTEYEKE